MHNINTNATVNSKATDDNIAHLAKDRNVSIIAAARTVVLLLSSTILGSGIALATNLLLAQHMGPNGFGIFSASLVCITIVSPLAGLGVDSFLLKVFGREGWMARRWVSPVMRFVCFSSLAVIGILIAYSLLGHVRQAELIWVMTPIVLAQVALMLACSQLQLEEQYSRYALLQNATNCLRFVVVVIVSTFVVVSPATIATIYGTVSLVIFLYVLPSVKKLMAGHIQLKGHGEEFPESSQGPLPTVTDVAKESWQFGMSSFLYLLYYQSSIVLLSSFVGERAAGEFNAVNLIIGASFLFPSVLFQRYLMPKLHRWSNSNLRALHLVYSRGSVGMLISGLIAGLIIFCFSTQLIELLFGKSFERSAPILALLSVCIPIRFVAAPADAILTSGRQLISKLRVLGFAAILCLILNATLIPIWGVYAAVLSTIVCEIYIAFSLHAKALHLLRAAE